MPLSGTLMEEVDAYRVGERVWERGTECGGGKHVGYLTQVQVRVGDTRIES